MTSAQEMGCVTTASIFFLMRSMDAKASLQSAFSGRSSSKRMEPFAPFFLPTTLNVPASAARAHVLAERQIDVLH